MPHPTRFLTRHAAILMIVPMLLTSPSYGRASKAAVNEPPSATVVALGALLFSDASLSADGHISCASCHQPGQAFADGRPLAIGVDGKEGTRNVPSLINSAERHSLFWDGRRDRLELLVLDPLFGSREHALRDAADLESRVRGNDVEQQAYSHAFGNKAAVDKTHIAEALAAFVRTLQGKKSAFERYVLQKDQTALTAQQMAGFELFRGRAGCVACHRIDGISPLLADDQFHNQGIGAYHLQPDLATLVSRASTLDPTSIGETVQSDPAIAALGRFVVTRQASDIGAFRTPSLLNVERTAPYMHDGSISTLPLAVDHELYYSASDRGAGFSHEERETLVAFLQSLSSVGLAN